MGDQRQWFIMREGHEQGPVSVDELKQLVKQGHIQHETKVRVEGKEWVPARRVKGLMPKLKRGTILVVMPAGQEQVSKARLELYLQEDRLAFDRPVASIDGGKTWLRPAEAIMALEEGVEVQGFGDPTAFDAFGGQEIKIGKKELKAVSVQQQHALLRPWQTLAGLLLCVYFLPAWIDLHNTWFAWDLYSVEGGRYAEASVLAALFAGLGVCIFPIVQYAHGILRGILIGVLGLIGTVAVLIAAFGAEHAISDLLDSRLLVLFAIDLLVLGLFTGANFLRSYFPGSDLTRYLAGISGLIHAILALVLVSMHLGSGWFGYGFDDQPFYLWITSVAFWVLLGATGTSGVLAGANMIGSGSGAMIRANLAHFWSTRALMLFGIWLGILPIWYFAPQITEPQGMPWMSTIFTWLGSLRGLLYLGGGLFLLASGVVDSLREHLIAEFERRKAEALAEAQRLKRTESE